MHLVDEMICRSLKGSLSTEETRWLDAWKQASPANTVHYTQLVRILATVSAVADRDDAVHTPTAADLVRVAETAGLLTNRKPARFPKSVSFIQVAAAVIIMALGGLFYATRHGPSEFRMGSGEYVSGPNETTTASLADGTVVRLAPNSRLQILDIPGKREVFLTGHAFLAVAHMPDRPFRVRTSMGEVAVLGTRFDVLASSELRVVVMEGKVELSSGRDRVEVPAGQMSMITNGELIQPVTIDVRPFVAWIGRFIAFHETPLRDVATELEQAYGATVVLQDSRMANLTVTGWYTDRTFEEIIVIVCGVLGVECSIHNGTATIGK